MAPTLIIKKTLYNVPRLTEAERVKAMMVSRHLFPQDTPCMVCGYEWMQHHGMLCPAKPGYFSKILNIPIPPVDGDTAFVPDEEYFKNPNYEVM